MFHQRLFLFCLASLALHAQPGVAQSQSGSPTIIGTATLTVPLQSLYTIYEQPTATVALSEEGGIVTTATLALLGGLQATAVAVEPGYAINNLSEYSYAYCWYPVSGNWGFQPRVLFYVTIIFALLWRAHEWLVAGALAASLTFSGVAAIQICLQVWTKQAVAELDLFAILGILSTSCIIAIPLMNWSSTIRDLGLPEQQKKARARNESEGLDKELEELPKEQQEGKRYSSGTLTVIVFWALFVAVGFISGFVGIYDQKHEKEYVSVIVDSGTSSVHCVPDGGQLNLTAGQLPNWWYFWFNEEFMTANNCENPCNSVQGGAKTLFRSPDDLKILTARSIDIWFEETELTYRQSKNKKFTEFYFNILLFGLPFIIVQGFMHLILFRRHSPQEARRRIYKWITKANDPRLIPGLLRKGTAMTAALSFYLFALLVLVLSPFALVINIAATEVQMRTIPQSEDASHVGQWGVMAGTALVIVAAFICRFEPSFQAYLDRGKDIGKRRLFHEEQTGKQRKRSIVDREYWVDLHADIQTLFLGTLDKFAWECRNLVGIFTHEWRLFVIFWNDPLRHPTRRVKPPRPERRRRRYETLIDNHFVGPNEFALIRSPQWRGDFRPDKSYVKETKHPETRVQPVQQAYEAEHPSITHNPLNRQTLSSRPGHSTVFAKGSTQASPPSVGDRRQTQARKPVPLNRSIGSDSEMQPVMTEHGLSPHTQPAGDRESSTVMGSLADSIGQRARRSNMYSPGLDEDEGLAQETEDQLSPMAKPGAHQKLSHSRSDEGLIPAASEDSDDDVPPLPPPKNSLPPSRDPREPMIPALSTRSSNLFSEDELARWYRDGTPLIRSVMPSRNSVASPTAPAAEPAAANARVRYLQIQTGDDFANAENWGNQVVLRRDRHGRWVVVDAGEEQEQQGSI